MSYTPTEWNTGDTITAEKLNKLEAGVAGADTTLYLTMEYDDEASEEREMDVYKAIDKAGNEVSSGTVLNLIFAGNRVVASYDSDTYFTSSGGYLLSLGIDPFSSGNTIMTAFWFIPGPENSGFVHKFKTFSLTPAT